MVFSPTPLFSLIGGTPLLCYTNRKQRALLCTPCEYLAKAAQVMDELCFWNIEAEPALGGISSLFP
jgi:hypothetical protein